MKLQTDTNRKPGVDVLVYLVLATFMLATAGCQTGVENDNNPDNWPVSSVYSFEYDDNGNKISERNDMDNDGDSDISYSYRYDLDGKLLGFDMMKHGEGYNGEYRFNASGHPSKLVQTSNDGTKQEVWTYANNVQGQRLSYNYDDGDEKISGRYTLDINGNILKLVTDKDEKWTYKLDGNGKTLSYEYTRGKNNTLYRVGIYEYDANGNVSRILHKNRL